MWKRRRICRAALRQLKRESGEYPTAPAELPKRSDERPPRDESHARR